jgi:xyloglucan-specific endo-beta-1,4-glucanase
MRFRPQRVAVFAAATVLLVGGGIVTAVVAHAAVGCQVTYQVANQWPGGFGANVTVRNLGDPINGWSLRWTFGAGQTVTQAWNANVTLNTTGPTATNADWNAAIGTNGTASFGFNGTWNNSSNPAPTSFTLNNVACTGGVTNPPTTQPTTTQPPPSGQQCAAFATITAGKYWLNNNLWGQSSGTGTQCISLNSVSGSTISWSTTWNWSGQSNQVKSYSSAVLGWHWGWMLSNTGLPVQLSANRSIATNWQFQVNQSGTMNVAYDLWLHTISNPGSSDNPTDEVMIWPYRAGGAGPAGTLQATVSLGGSSWDLYRGVVGSWNVFSFVRTSNATSLNINLRDFLNNLVSRGWMSSSKFLTSIESGTEVFIGNGRLDTTAYSVTIS